MSKIVVVSMASIFAITSVVWIAGVSNHIFLLREFWIYVGIFLVPAASVCACIWLISRDPTWRRVLGFIVLIPSTGIWLLSLLLVYHGFKIH